VGRRFDEQIRLDDSTFSTPEIALIAGVPERTVRKWLDRGILAESGRGLTGRKTFSLLDAFKIAVMNDLVALGLPPSSAVLAGDQLIRCVRSRVPNDANGRPLAQPGAISPTLEMHLEARDGQLDVGLRDTAEPGWTATRLGHVYLGVPVAAQLDGVLERLIELAAKQPPEAV
jgi:hypothetical protein